MPRHIVICIALVASITRLSSSMVFIYDQHMNRALMANSGSKWHIQYDKAYARKSATLLHKIITNVLWTGQLDASGSLEIPIPADQLAPSLGRYRLTIYGEKNITFTISYSLCPDTSDECQNNQKCSTDEFCMNFLNKDGEPTTETCKVPTKDMCNFHGKLTICSNNEMAETLCQTYTTKTFDPYFARLTPMNTRESCIQPPSPIILFADGNTFVVIGKYFFRNVYVPYRPTSINNLTVYCFGQFTWCLSSLSSKEAEPQCKKEVCEVNVKNLLPASSPGASMTLHVKFEEAFSYIHIVDMPLELDFMKTSPCMDLRCAVKMDDSDKRFRARWTVHRNDILINASSSFESPMIKTFKVDKEGMYNCTAIIRFRSCSPFYEQIVTLKTSLAVQKSDFDQGACGKFVTADSVIGESIDSGSSSSTTIVVVVLLIVLGLVVAGGVAIYRFRHKFVFRPQKVQKVTPAKKSSKKSSPLKAKKNKQNISVISILSEPKTSKHTGDHLTLPPMSVEDMPPDKGNLKR